MKAPLTVLFLINCTLVTYTMENKALGTTIANTCHPMTVKKGDDFMITLAEKGGESHAWFRSAENEKSERLQFIDGTSEKDIFQDYPTYCFGYFTSTYRALQTGPATLVFLKRKIGRTGCSLVEECTYKITIE